LQKIHNLSQRRVHIHGLPQPELHLFLLLQLVLEVMPAGMETVQPVAVAVAAV